MRLPNRPSLATFAILFAVACGGRIEPPAPPAPRPIAELEALEARSLARLLRMEDTRTLDTALVAELLRSRAPEIRARAALAAGRLREPAATPLLLRAAADSSEWVRGRAAFALGQSGDTAADVIAELSRIALADATGPAMEAVAALSRTGAPAARTVIDSLLTDATRHIALRNEAATAAWRLTPDSATYARLAAFATQPDGESRWRAIYALSRTGSAAALPILLQHTADADHRVRAHAVRGLRAAFADSAELVEPALAALLVAARDSHPHVRINALRWLPGYEQPNRTTGVLVELLGDEDANVAVASAQALAETNSATAAGPLARLARDSSRPLGLRTAALATLVQLDADAALAVAREWIGAPEWLLRRQAARTLGSATWTDAAGPLQQLARDPHHLVATDAVNTVRALADTLPGTRRLFIEALGAEHVLVRAAAARGLGTAATAADLDVLLQAYDRARHDPSPEAALAILAALGRIGEAGTPVDRTFYLRFGEAGPPTNPVLYRAIAQRIGDPPRAWAEPDTVRDTPPLEFYDDVVRTLVAPVLAGGAPPHVVIGTPHGEILLELASADAPLTVHNFLSLIGRGYYQDTRWHRVVPNFVIQDGDPRGDGSGNPGHTIRDEINTLRYLRGTLGMALSGPDTGGGQYFITHSPQPHLDGGYTVFGRVVVGMDAVDRVVQEEDILYIRVVR